MISRHSLRAPSHISNWSNPADYPLGLGYLTRDGKQLALAIGSKFRHFYHDFLTDSPREVWARSSTYPRCYETASLLLATMYPPKRQWYFGFPTQPIPIIMVPNGNDVNVEDCKAPTPPNFQYMYNETSEALTSDGFENAGQFFDWLTAVSGFPNGTSDFYEPIVDALYCQKYNGLPIPHWAREKAASMDWAMSRLSFEFWINFMPYYGQYMGKMVASQLDMAAAGTLNKRLSLFVYHDTTIQALLSALGLDVKMYYPSFLGTLHFQLYKKNDTGELQVRVLLHQGITENGDFIDSKRIELPGCPSGKCGLNKFSGIMNNLYPETDRKSCKPVELDALL